MDQKELVENVLMIFHRPWELSPTKLSENLEGFSISGSYFFGQLIILIESFAGVA